MTKKTWLPALALLVVAGSFFLTPHPAWADPNSFTPEVPIPGTEFSGDQAIDNDLFGRYVRAIYIYFIWVVGIVATFMVIYAGVRWVAAAGDQGRFREAREIINNAIIGVIIGLTSVVLLNLLSPNFTTLSIPGTTQVTKLYYEGAAVTRVCNPNKDGDKYQLQCGSVRIIGSREDKNGKTEDTFCMGTICGRAEICQLGKDVTTGFYKPGNGCVKSVAIDNPAGDYQTISSLPVYSGRVFGPACSSIYKDIVENTTNPVTKVGFFCSAWGNDSVCYMVGNKAIIHDIPVGFDDVSNIFCPPL